MDFSIYDETRISNIYLALNMFQFVKIRLESLLIEAFPGNALIVFNSESDLRCNNTQTILYPLMLLYSFYC